MLKQTLFTVALILGSMTAAVAQMAQEIRGTVIQIEQSEKEAMVMLDGREQVLLIKNLTKFSAGELSLLKSSLEQSIPVKLKTHGNEILAISSK